MGCGFEAADPVRFTSTGCRLSTRSPTWSWVRGSTLLRLERARSRACKILSVYDCSLQPNKLTCLGGRSAFQKDLRSLTKEPGSAPGVEEQIVA